MLPHKVVQMAGKTLFQGPVSEIIDNYWWWLWKTVLLLIITQHSVFIPIQAAYLYKYWCGHPSFGCYPAVFLEYGETSAIVCFLDHIKHFILNSAANLLISSTIKLDWNYSEDEGGRNWSLLPSVSSTHKTWNITNLAFILSHDMRKLNCFHPEGWNTSLLFSLQIFQYLNVRDLLSCAEVCCKWKCIIQMGTLWSQVCTALNCSSWYSLIVKPAARFETGAHFPLAMSPSDQLLCGERVAEWQHGAAGSEDLSPVCDPSQPAWLHLAEMAQFSEHL